MFCSCYKLRAVCTKSKQWTASKKQNKCERLHRVRSVCFWMATPWLTLYMTYVYLLVVKSGVAFRCDTKKPGAPTAVRSFRIVKLPYSVTSPTCRQRFGAIKSKLWARVPCTPRAPFKVVHAYPSLLKSHRSLWSSKNAPPRVHQPVIALCRAHTQSAVEGVQLQHLKKKNR